MNYFIGVDGGGSHVRVVVVDENLRSHGYVEGKSVNPSSVGHETARERIQEALRAVLRAAPSTRDQIAGVGVGIAGASAEHSADWLREVIAAVLPDVPVIASSDLEIALTGAHGQRYGALLLAGTGSAALAISEDGRSALVDGWGYLLGDEGSGFWLGQQALKAITLAADGRGPATRLVDAILPHLNLSQPRGLIRWLYHGEQADTARIAGLAPLVLQVCDHGDDVAERIVEQAAHNLVTLCRTALARINAPEAPIAFGGGLLTRDNALSRRVCELLNLPEIPRPRYDPVYGAALLAKLETKASAPIGVTEARNPRSAEIDKLDTLAMLRIINAEDQGVPVAIAEALPQIAAAVDVIAAKLGAGGRLFYVGAGTSGRLGVLDAVECVPTFGTPPELVQALIAGGDRAFVRAVEGAEDDREAGASDLTARGLTAADVVVGIAASGRTPYVLGAVEAARRIGAATIGVACNAPAPLLDAVDTPIGVPVGPEVITGSTRMKAGTAQKLVLNMLSTGAMIRLGKVYGNLMVDVRVTNAKLSDRANRIVREVTGATADQAAEALKLTNNDVKLSIVMIKQGVSLGEATRLLASTEGRLRDIID